MAGQVRILGDGLAACCAAHRLWRRGFSVTVQRTSRPKPARLLIGEQTQSLLRDIFDAPRLFEQTPRIRRRIVRWGNQLDTVELPHSGLVISEQELLDDLWRRLPCTDEKPLSGGAMPQHGWTMVSLPNYDALPVRQGFGSRLAVTALATLASGAPQDCCWVESLPEGWLFLLSAGDGQAALIASGSHPRRLIEESSLIARQLSNLHDGEEFRGIFPAFPQILESVSGPGWLACGSAAMTCDPLCGEGAGHAAREALLASAAIDAASRGHAAEDLLAHYSTRLMQGFLRHLRACLPFYESGGSGHFWKTETAALQRGITWMENRLRGRAPFLFRLAGFELEPVAEAGMAP